MGALTPKPWGSEELLEINEKYMLKKLVMRSGHKCSLQYHKNKIETIYVLKGLLRIYLGSDENSLSFKDFAPGESVTIPAGEIHRMEGINDSVYLEASTPEIDDVIRIQDDYSRV
tara:strand:- start:410 stop:754 length:345 start_codon:yes stop_codon:yes gene_type:complete